MKDQYAGDQNDYVKFGLLRALCGAELKPFIAWMHTPDDAGSDGRRLGYLEDKGAWRAHDPKLFDALQAVVKKDARNVKALEKAVFIANATFSHAPIPQPATQRMQWLHEQLILAEGHELVFFDPDNGIEVESTPFGSTGASKFVYWDELEATFQEGHSVLIYQHYPRVSRDAFAAQLADTLREYTNCHEAYAFHTKHVLFLLAVQKDHARALRQGIAEVEARWKPAIWLHGGAEQVPEPVPSAPRPRR